MVDAISMGVFITTLLRHSYSLIDPHQIELKRKVTGTKYYFTSMLEEYSSKLDISTFPGSFNLFKIIESQSPPSNLKLDIP